MTPKVSIIVVMLTILSFGFGEESLKPYILIGESGESVEQTSSEILRAMFMNNFEILGQYSPAGNPDRYVFVVTNEVLQAAVKLGARGAAFLGGIHIGISAKGKMTYISCQDPDYWGNAYFGADYPKVRLFITKFRKDLLKAMPKFRMRSGIGFGSETGLTAEALQDFHYPRKKAPGLKDLQLLGEYPAYAAAVATLEAGLGKEKSCRKVFELEYPGGTRKLIGIEVRGKVGEASILKLLDTGPRKNTAFLPFEVLIVEGNIYWLDPRYRIPLSFPDLPTKLYKKIDRLTPDLRAEIMEIIR